MRKLSLEEVQGPERYEQSRPALRSRIIELKKHRRVGVGDRVTFVFENRDTMLFQVQEMVRAEHIVDLDKVRDELDVYNALIPDSGELSATVFIEITDSVNVRDELARLIGIDECVHLQIGNDISIPAQFEPGRSTDEKLSAVQYVRFKLDERARQAFAAQQRVELVIDHPNYRHAAVLSPDTRQSLTADLAAQ